LHKTPHAETDEEGRNSKKPAGSSEGLAADLLGEPPAVVQRWASDGMPVRKQGRYVETTPEELNAWLGKESGKPVHVATDDTDLTAELKRGLSFVRREQESEKKTSKKARGR
jgi:hypothetical protein